MMFGNKVTRHRSVIHRKLALDIISISSVLTLVLVVIQLGNYYKTLKLQEIERIEMFFQVTEKPLANSLWRVELDLLQKSIEGALSIPGVKGVELNTIDGVELKGGQLPKLGNSDWEVFTHHIIWQNESVAELVIYTSHELIHDKVFDQAVWVLLSNAMKTLVMITAVFWLVNYLVVRHLNTLAIQAQSLSMARLDVPFALEQKTGEPDELDSVTQALEGMRLKLRKDLAQRLQAERRLKHYQQHLQELVKSRTKVLDWRRQVEQMMSELSIRVMSYPYEQQFRGLESALKDIAMLAQLGRVVIYRIEKEQAEFFVDACHLTSPSQVFNQDLPYSGSSPLLQMQPDTPIQICDVSQLEAIEQQFWQGLEVGSILLMPLFIAEEISGFVAFTDQEVRQWQENDLYLIHRTAELVSHSMIHFENSERLHLAHQELTEANRRLQTLADTDELTGLYNRRPFFSRLRHILSHAKRGGFPLGVLLCDIDFFKRYNDTYGHLKGDETLVRVATALRRSLRREHDMVTRYGGEEFACIVMVKDQSELEQIIHNIQQRIAELSIPHQDSTAACHVTLSIGAIMYQSDRETSPKELLKSADEALYQAKDKGRATHHIQVMGQLNSDPEIKESPA